MKVVSNVANYLEQFSSGNIIGSTHFTIMGYLPEFLPVVEDLRRDQHHNDLRGLLCFEVWLK